MEVSATAKYVRVQPRKVRIIADQVRGKPASHTVALLRYHPSKSAKALRKVLISAMANAQENHNLSPDVLKISVIMVDQGPTLKRMQARAMGRGNRIMKKTSHITVIVEDQERTPTVRPHGTKAKPRPTFAAPTKGKKRGTVKAAPAEVEEATPVVIEEITPVTASEAPEQDGGTTPEAPVAEAASVTTEDTPEQAPEESGSSEGADSEAAPATEEPVGEVKEAE
jgi:large subunit ribosomal protein L22